MFGIGTPELIIILVIALVVMGPQKLPELARSLGKGIAEFKRASNDFRAGIEREARVQEEKERLAKESQAIEQPVAQSADATVKENAVPEATAA